MKVEAQQTYSTSSDQVLEMLSKNGWMSPEEVQLAEQKYKELTERLTFSEAEYRTAIMALRWLHSAVVSNGEGISLHEAVRYANSVLGER